MSGGAWYRFCCGLGTRLVRAGSIGRDASEPRELPELPPEKAGGPSPRLIHGEISALWFQSDQTGSQAMGPRRHLRRTFTAPRLIPTRH